MRAISSGVPSLPIGLLMSYSMPDFMTLSLSFITSFARFFVPWVHIPPGTRTFILNPCLLYSLAKALERTMTPALVMS